MVCGRWPLAIASATLFGAVPCILINRILFAGLDDEAALAAWVLLGIEAAWASAPLTIVLGQSVFSNRFSWRGAGRSFLAGLPAMIVFQGVIRGICLAIWVLAPVVFVGMYYLDHVILLERPALSRVWRRRAAINRGQIAHILKLACIDGLVLVLGTILGTRLLAATVAIWRGRGIGWAAIADGNGGIVSAIFSWHGQIAFWTTCGFLTVFRFFTYLDGRIRREGWDVELRLRSEETYACLRDFDSPRRHGTVSALVVAAALAASTVAARGGDVNGGAPSMGRAHDALARQSFPWYDAAADRYRPLIRREGPAGETSPASGRSSPSTNSTGNRRKTDRGENDRAESERKGKLGDRVSAGSGMSAPPGTSRPLLSLDPATLDIVGWAFMLALLVATVVGLMVVIVRYGIHSQVASTDDLRIDDAALPVVDAAEVLPAGLQLADGDLLERATAYAEQGNFTAAMLHFHAWMLVELDRRGGLALARGKTNGQYHAEIAAKLPALAGLFNSSSRLFEDAFFGRLSIEEAEFLTVWEQRGRVNSPTPPIANAL